jgi:hypothetical protein
MANLKIKLAIATIITSLLFVSFSENDNAVGTNNAPFAFIEVGNEWVYGMYNKDNELLGEAKFKIVSGSDGCFETNFSESYDSYWYADDNLWKTHSNEHGEGGYVALYKDTYIGQKWEVMGKYEMKVVSVSETISVPAGSFDMCIKVEMTYKDGGSMFQNWWFCKDFGIIKRETLNGSMQLHSKNF